MSAFKHGLGVLGDNCYTWWSPVLFAHRVRHRLTGPQRGCSCSRCFHHPRRRIPAREFYATRQRVTALEDRMRELERRS